MKKGKVHSVIQAGKEWKFVEAGIINKPTGAVTVYNAFEETFDVFGNRYFAQRASVQSLPIEIGIQERMQKNVQQTAPKIAQIR
jgi:hypothetical protein